MSLEIESLESQNNHPSSTAKNETRYQLWMERMINKKLGEQREVRTYQIMILMKIKNSLVLMQWFSSW